MSEQIFMRMNGRQAKWESVPYSWDTAEFLLGDNYDLLLVRNGEKLIKNKGQKLNNGKDKTTKHRT